MKKYYMLMTVFMLLPLVLAGVAYVAARDAIMPDIGMHLLCGGVTLLCGLVFMLQVRKALKKGGTYVGRPSNRVKVSGKKGARQLMLTGLLVTGAASTVFSALILAEIL